MTTFILKDPSAKVKTLIYFTYYFNGYRMKMSTGEKIHPDDWSSVKHRPKSTAEYADTLTKYLDRFEARAKEAHLSLKADFVTVTPDKLRQAIERDIRTGGKRETFVEYFERYIKESTGRQSQSIKPFRSALNVLRRYTGAKDFDDINGKWLEKYQAYMERSGYAANTIGKQITIIQSVVGAAKKEGLTRNGEYNDTDYRKPSEEVETIYLTEHELLKIYGIELPDYLDRVRNRFIIGAFTGLRFSDSAKITHDSIRQGLIFDRNIKTGGNVVIPIHWAIEQIMEDHPEGLPPSISNQKTNKYLKEIGERAGIDDTIIIRKVKGGKVVAERYKKYELISTHTARRSAISNMVLAGIPTQAVMSISGHRSEKSFQKYVKISKESNAMSIQNHPFFCNC